MRVAAIGLFLITFAVAIWVLMPSVNREPVAPLDVATNPVPKAVSPVADDGKLDRPKGSFPDDFEVFSVRADVSDELVGRLKLGTKLDVLLIPHGQDPALPPELVLSGVYFVPHSTIDVLDEKTGARLHAESCVILGVTRKQAEKLASADVRGRFRVVSAK